jgi:very-short-patch-repair endonuclease
MESQPLGKCLYCGKEFIMKTNHYDRKTTYQRFCSAECGNRNKRRVELYSIETKCECGCGSIILNPDDHYRYRKFIYGHQTKGKNHPRLGYKESEEHIEMRMHAIYAHFREEYSSLEKELYTYLDSLKIEYEKQKQMGRTRPDAFIPKLNLCIYADGIFWHSSDERKKIDSRCSKSLCDKGYLVIRLSSIGRKNILNMKPLQEFLLQNFNRIYSGASGF